MLCAESSRSSPPSRSSAANGCASKAPSTSLIDPTRSKRSVKARTIESTEATMPTERVSRLVMTKALPATPCMKSPRQFIAHPSPSLSLKRLSTSPLGMR